MKKTLLSLMTLLALVGCKKEMPVECNSAETKALAQQTLIDQLTNMAISQQKKIISEENLTVDTAKIRQTLKQFKIEINDVRTDKKEQNKQYCVANVQIEVPQQVIDDANTNADLYQEPNVATNADLKYIELKQHTFVKDINYNLQPTDDGKKLYINLDANDLLELSANTLMDALALPLRKNAVQAAQEQETIGEEEPEPTAEEVHIERMQDAQKNIEKANTGLNLVWNSTTSTVRDALLDEQRAWLKKRKLECQLQANDAEDSEKDITELNCQAEMTKTRTNALKDQIEELEASTP
ncbi:lysozyme inhibitor LprI family protein [Acinetobacter sp. HY1485]|uniref:lysozyme inhibitor LprI family protein n=1 Tax=Acinetobacter sp. HY1485 TaxID=2970918 RepID=UPI0022B99E9B|nr:lysozyme inhibitor LprI family protein [Acinetobacter sp. HY1485]